MVYCYAPVKLFCPYPPGLRRGQTKNGVIKNGGATKSEVMDRGGAAKF